MVHASVPADTSEDSFAILADRWRAMSISDRVVLIEQLCADVEQLARIGIATRDPGLTELEIARELSRRRYGHELTGDAYRDLLGR